MPIETAEVWLVDLERTAAVLGELETATRRLTDDDEARLRGAADTATRDRRRAAYIALRILLERAFGPGVRGMGLQRAASGKPSLPGLSGDFSLAHTAGLALVGTSRSGAIGVDLEVRRAVLIPDDRRGQIEAAGRLLNPSVPIIGDSEGRLLQSWVRLEALAKAEGSGVGQILTRMGVRRGVTPPAPDRAAPSPIGAFAVHDVDAGPQRFAAVALAPGQRCPTITHFPVDAAAVAALVAG